MRTVFITLR